MNKFRIYLAQEAYPFSNDNEQALRLFLQQAVLGEVFLDEADIESLNWPEQMLILTRTATEIMLSNWADFSRDDEELLPQGKYPEAENKFFILTLGEQRLNGGVIASPMTLYQPPACPLIYPGQPLVQDERLVLGIGYPKIDEYGEDFLKVFIEVGAPICFSPILGEEVKDHFARLGKLAN